ncbi:hypothetical protein Dimus_017105 [Dionaea muscipula]
MGEKKMGLNSPKLSLDLSLPLFHPPTTIPDFLSTLSISSSSASSLSSQDAGDDTHRHELTKLGLDGYIKGFADELKKIEAFKSEFPLSVILLNDVIDRLRKEKKKCREKEAAVFKCNSDGFRGVEMELDQNDKKGWMSSVQLWGSTPSSPPPPRQPPPNPSTFLQLDLPRNEEDDRVASDKLYESGKCNENRGALSSFPKSDDPIVSALKQDAANLTLTPSRREVVGIAGLAGGGCRPTMFSDPIRSLNKMPTPPYLAARKQRRCWSPELHRRFIDALGKLGGSQVATPKQIRELMQVEGLTNDEVKSHLQKYRLHIRKVPSSSSPTSSNEISMGQVLQLDITSKAAAGISLSGSPNGPFQLAIRSTNCNSPAASGESSMEDDQGSDDHR